ncbi:YSIRK-type signal peptide-containing protein [Dolosigranulum pigrum]|uniref:Rib/alpha-like domain-containing protein n=1 Tax=Dolosigranulum pigrum TaxID=29394 RepID=UPI001AD898E1|nr:Rib/alpha-like domain-containing protein [Dolosigranulum pigrum]QTJ42082.1 YSIRK-type signal peptide-containing protein [Dolosigranulum pigrum]
MVGKNNKQARWSKSANTFKRYSLKKLSVGVASVVIGTGVAWASSTTVHAAEEGTEVVTGDGEKEEPVESAVPTEAPVVGGDESSSHDAVADLVNEIVEKTEAEAEVETPAVVVESAEEKNAQEKVEETLEPRAVNSADEDEYEPIPDEFLEDAELEDKDDSRTDAVTLEQEDEDNQTDKSDTAKEKLSKSTNTSIQPRATKTDNKRYIFTKANEDQSKKYYEGRVFKKRTIDGNFSTAAYQPQNGDEPLANVNVYLQYVNGSGQVSPTFYTTSDSEGNVKFDLSNEFTAAHGAPQFQLAGDPNFLVRTWIDNPDPANLMVARPGDGVNPARFHSRTKRNNEAWNFTAGVNRITGGRFVLQERPNTNGNMAKPKEDRVDVTGRDQSFGRVVGTVWWENRQPSGSVANAYHYNGSRGDRYAVGTEVVASYLNDAVAKQLDEYKNQHKNWNTSGLDAYKKFQHDLFDRYQQENGKGSHIAETVVGKVRSDGTFQLPFKGTYGWTRDRENQPAQVGNKLQPGDFGTVAADYAENPRAVFTGERINGAKKRHINTDYMYVYPNISGQRDIWMGGMHENFFQDPSTSIVGFGVNERNGRADLNFALLTANPLFNINEYEDTPEGAASPGDTATTTLTGLIPNQNYAVQWVKDGKVVDGSTTPFVTDNSGNGPEGLAKFTIPESAKDGDRYTAVVVDYDPANSEAGDEWLLADSLRVKRKKDAEKVEPSYKPQTITPGEEVTTEAPTFDKTATADKTETDPAPEGTTYKLGENASLPEGVTAKVHEKTGAVTITSSNNTPVGDFTVPVTVTYSDKSTDNAEVKVSVETPAPSIERAGNPTTVTEGEEKPLDDKVNNPTDGMTGTITNSDGTPIQDGKVTVDENTGEIKVKVPAGTVPEGQDSIPGKVQIKDKNGENVGDPIDITIDKPEAEKPAPSIERAGNPTTVTEGEEKPLDDKVNNPTDGMTGTITNSDGTPIQDGKVTVDENTGEIKVKVPAGTVPEGQDSIPGKVQIKDKNGENVGDPIDITIDKAKDETPAPSIERAGNPTTVTEGEEKPLDDKVNNPTDGMTGTITNSDGTPIQDGKVTVDENTGEIKVKVPAGTVPEGQDSIPGKVQIKDKNGENVGDPIDITIDKPEAEKPAPSIERAGNPTTVTEGEEKPLDDKVNNPTDGMTGTITNSDGTPIQDGKVTVDENTGEIKVKVPAGTVPEDQDSIPGKVQIKDNNGNDVGNPIDITIDKAKDETPAPSVSGYEDKTITEGRPIEPITPEITNKGEGDITANGLPDGLDINPETGEITGTPDVKDWNDNFNSENPSASEFEDERDFKVTVTVPGQPESIAEFTITVQRDTDGDGTADVNDPDSDGDGINDNVELERGTNPKDANDFKGPELSVNTPKKGEETVSGKTEPQTSVTVKDTDGTVIGQGVSDEEGNFEVPVNRPLKGGEELDVTAGAPDNDKDQTTERVTVDTPDNEEYEPKWEDTNAEDGKRVVVPNTGDEIPAGSTTTATITEDPNNKGKANWTVTVDDNGDVEVTPGSDAQPGDSATVTVETTYPDGSKDSSSFKVTVPTIQSFEYDPQGQDIEVPEGAEPNAADGIANKDELPEGTEFEFDGPVDTSTPGEKKAKVIVAYPDGSTDTVDVTVNVTEVPTQADNHEPKGKDIEVPEGAEPDAANGIANKDELPEGTEFEFDGPVDTSTPGEKKAKVIVAYPDGSTDTVDVTVNVTEVPTQADKYEPKGNPLFVEKNGTPNPADGIANKDELPEGTEFEFDGPVDTSTPGEKKAKVIVAYPDGSTDAVDVTVNVTDGDTPQSEIFEPQGQDIKVPEGGQPNAADGIANKDELPEGTEFEFDGPVDTSTPGKKKAKVIVAYPDGSTDTVDVTVNVTPKPTAETLEPKWNDSDAKDGGPVTVPNTGDKIPAGSTTTATITEDPNNKGKANWTVTVGEDGSVTVTPGADAQPGDSATVTVETTYPDGSKDSSSFKVTVPEKGKTTAETLEPKWNDSDAKDGGPVTVPNTGDKIPAGSTTTATITEDPNNKGKGNWTVTVGEDGSVTVTPGVDAQPGDSATVTVETTYPDGSKDSSSFKVTVPAVGPTHAHGDSLVHDKPSYDLDKLGHGQTQPSRPAEDKGQGQVQDKAQTPDVDKAGLPNYVPSQSGERLPDTATGAWVLGVVGLMSTGLGSALGLKRKKEDEE